MRRVCLLLSCWTLVYLDPVLGSFSRTGTSEQQPPRRQLEAATGEAEGGPAHRSHGAAAPLTATRIRAGPPPIKGETTRGTLPHAWQQLRGRSSARPWTSAGTADTRTGAGRGGSAHGSAAGAQRHNAAPAALRGRGNVRGRDARPRGPRVVPHDYMLSLYWSLSSGNGSAGTANTVTSLVDQGQGEPGSRDGHL